MSFPDDSLILQKKPLKTAWGVPCQFSWNTTSGGFGFRDNQGLKDFLSLCQFGTRLLISFITLVTLTMVYWYTELERRLFVVRKG